MSRIEHWFWFISVYLVAFACECVQYFEVYLKNSTWKPRLRRNVLFFADLIKFRKDLRWLLASLAHVCSFISSTSHQTLRSFNLFNYFFICRFESKISTTGCIFSFILHFPLGVWVRCVACDCWKEKQDKSNRALMFVWAVKITSTSSSRTPQGNRGAPTPLYIPAPSATGHVGVLSHHYPSLLPRWRQPL